MPGAVAWPGSPLTPVVVARVVDTFARGNAVDAVSIDGPQGWRDPDAPADRPGAGRACEYAARAQGKTGTRGVAYPMPYLGWIAFSIGVFAELLRLPGVELVNEPAVRLKRRTRGYWLLECLPTSTWRTSGLKPLPGKRNTPPEDVEAFAWWLAAAYQLPAGALTRNHDDLQALVATLPGVALLGGPAKACPRGEAARLKEDSLVEGFIWDAAPAKDVTESPLRELSDRVCDETLDAGIERGVELFRELVDLASSGRAIGTSYVGFLEHVYGASFSSLRARPWSQSDTREALELAERVTARARARGRQGRAPARDDSGEAALRPEPHVGPQTLDSGYLPRTRRPPRQHALPLPARRWDVVAKLPQADFSLRLATVREWLASRADC